MSNKLYVGNLSYSTRDDELRRAFEPFGSLVSVAVISDRMTGQPRGFGFVEYQSADDAQKAMASLDGQELDGRSINVTIARARESQPRFNDGPSRFNDGPPRRGGGAGGGKGGRGNRW